MSRYNLEYYHKEADYNIKSLRKAFDTCDDAEKIELAIYELQHIKNRLAGVDPICGLDGLRGIR